MPFPDGRVLDDFNEFFPDRQVAWLNLRAIAFWTAAPRTDIPDVDDVAAEHAAVELNFRHCYFLSFETRTVVPK